MNTKAIIYDDSCPLCVLYTTWFVKKGWLPKEGKISFSQLEEPYLSLIDTQKSKHYIPYVDPNTKQVWYGPEALVQILKPNFPILEKLYNIGILKKASHIAYDFISYNRRVIAAKQATICNFDCAPEFSKFWRIAFILFATIISTLIFKSVLPILILPLCLVIIHFVGSKKFKRDKQYDLTGYLATCFLIAALVFAPFKILSSLIHFPILQYLGIAIGGIIAIFEMNRRLVLLK